MEVFVSQLAFHDTLRAYHFSTRRENNQGEGKNNMGYPGFSFPDGPDDLIASGIMGGGGEGFHPRASERWRTV